MRTTLAVLVLCSTWALAPTGPARAQQPPDTAPPNELHTSTQAAMEREAAQYFERGRVAYASGDYEGAAVAFEAAYRLTADPALLYNQYLSCRRSGATARAADALAQYIRSMPQGPERGALEDDLRTMNRELGRPENTGLEASTSTTTSTSTHATHPPGGRRRPPVEHGPSVPIVSIALWGAGGAALVAGTILGITVMGTQSDLEAACPGGFCDASRQSDIDSGRTRALVADVLLFGGAALAIGGVVLWLVLGGRHTEPTAEHATVRRSRGPRLRAAGPGVALDWSF